jgi:hypothetical protein
MSDAQAHEHAAAPRGGKRSADGEEGAAAGHAPREREPCMPCHGSGKVISNLGGHARKLTCPWCRGGGLRLTGVDAQQWQQEQAASRVR